MSSAVLLDMTSFVSLLCQKGEGLAYLDQLGVDLAPKLSQEEETRLAEAVSRIVAPPEWAGGRDYTSLSDTITASSRRITLVADLTPRRSLVAFVANDAVASFALSGQEIVASDMDISELKDILSDSMSTAMIEGVHWTAARWEGGERVLALGSDGGDVSITGGSVTLAKEASESPSITGLSDVIVS
jgi:hypothetical protein